VGALPVPPEEVAFLLTDGDTRWIHRGAYDLMGVDRTAPGSAAGLPRARALYGALPDQLAQPDSFARQLQHLLAVRERYRIYQARQIDVPAVAAAGLLVLVHELPEGFGVQVTALNFGRTPVAEPVAIAGVRAGSRVLEMLSEHSAERISDAGELSVALEPYAGKSYLILEG
jgi:trehalose synthase